MGIIFGYLNLEKYSKAGINCVSRLKRVNAYALSWFFYQQTSAVLARVLQRIRTSRIYIYIERFTVNKWLM
jgi:hypothetical protein